MSLKRFKYLKGASLAESVVAIAIITICMSIAFMIYVQVMSTTVPVYLLEAQQEVVRLTSQVIEEKDYKDALYNYPYYKIEKMVKVDEALGLVYLNYSIKSGEKTYVEQRIIAYDQE
jgi:hypothetical protein